MRHAGLFSGIGGFSLAAQMMGWENVFDVEIDEWCRKVLHKNFPNTLLFDDVCTFDGLPFRGRIDVLSGGFPCQPWSDAGLKLGTADPRHLWPEYLRIIREIQPRYVVGENVRGLLNWRRGIQFEAVCADLEAAGYDVQTFLLPAVGVDAIHERYRLWFVAHANRERQQEWDTARVAAQSGRTGGQRATGPDAADTNPGRRGAHEPDLWRGQQYPFGRFDGDAPGIASHVAPATPFGQKRPVAPGATSGQSITNLWPTEPPLRAANDGLPTGLVRPDGTRILKAAGNAIVPQVAVQIFQAIDATDHA